MPGSRRALLVRGGRRMVFAHHADIPAARRRLHPGRPAPPTRFEAAEAVVRCAPTAPASGVPVGASERRPFPAE